MNLSDAYPEYGCPVGELSHSAYKGKTWAALLTGSGGRYGFKREFCRTIGKSVSQSGSTGTFYVALQGDGLYETVNEGKRSYWRLEGGELAKITKDEVVERLSPYLCEP